MQTFHYQNLGTLECLIDILILILTPPPINYWRKFPTQTNFMKQYTYADFSCDFAKETASLYCVLVCKLMRRSQHIRLCFIS